MSISLFENSIKFLSGDKAVCNLPYELSQFGCMRPLVLCDEPAFRLGPYNYVKSALDAADYSIARTYFKTENVATSKVCQDVANEYKAGQCDCIIVIGKKGAIATAKGAKILLCEDVHHVSHYDHISISDYGVREVPLFVIPTHLGTGIEASNFVRIYAKDTNKIYEFDTSYAASDEVIIDSLMTDILPPKAIASHTLFALAMAMECYANIGNVPMVCKAYADAAIKLLKKYGEKCLLRNANTEYRTKVLEAVVYAGAGYALLKRDMLAELSDIISDRYQINYPNVFAILFRQHIKNKEKDTAFGYALSALVDEAEYSMYAKDMRTQKLLSEIENEYLKIEKYVDFNNKLSSFKIPKEDLTSIAEQLISNHQDDYEYTKQEIEALLESVY